MTRSVPSYGCILGECSVAPATRGAYVCGSILGELVSATATNSATILKQIDKVLDQVRPAIRADGGDVHLIDFQPDSGSVQIRLVGACYDCPMATATLRAGIESQLRHVLPAVRSVEAVA